MSWNIVFLLKLKRAKLEEMLPKKINFQGASNPKGSLVSNRVLSQFLHDKDKLEN